jgi:hypothetical protein
MIATGPTSQRPKPIFIGRQNKIPIQARESAQIQTLTRGPARAYQPRHVSRSTTSSST